MTVNKDSEIFDSDVDGGFVSDIATADVVSMFPSVVEVVSISDDCF